MHMPTYASFEPEVFGHKIALERVDVVATLSGFMSEVSLTQRYRNLEAVNLEATYTFPLPLDAVLLAVELTLNGHRHHAVITGTDNAEQCYEDAVEDGHTGVLLSTPMPGLYSMNLGNLLAGECAEICVRYTQLHALQGGRISLRLPTTIAPRYGDPVAAGLQFHEVPLMTLKEAVSLTLTLTVTGALASGQIACPTHGVSTQYVNAKTTVSFAGGTAAMDRDVVVTVQPQAELQGTSWWAPWEEGVVALASFVTTDECAEAPKPRRLVLVLDCSSSMAGDSMAQAKMAMTEILNNLRPMDHFEIVLFGCEPILLWGGAQRGTRKNTQEAVKRLSLIDATMGRTALDSALEMAWALDFPDGEVDMFLITNGEVWNDEELLSRASQAGSRIFAIGVGSASVEATVQGLAHVSGGSYELVTPNENMAERIVDHFGRLDKRKVQSWDVVWPTGPQRTEVVAGQSFLGETRHVFAWFDRATSGGAVLAAAAGGETRSFKVNVFDGEPAGEALVRLAATSLIQNTSDEAEARRLAIAHQLITKHTSATIVHERDAPEQSDQSPVLRRVPQTLAAGWAGTGSVAYSADPSLRRRQDVVFRRRLEIRSKGLEPVDVPPPLMDVARALIWYPKLLITFEQTTWRLHVRNDSMLPVLDSLLATCAVFRGSDVPHAEVVRCWLAGLRDTRVKEALTEAHANPPSMTEARATAMIQCWLLVGDRLPALNFASRRWFAKNTRGSARPTTWPTWMGKSAATKSIKAGASQ